MLFCPLLSSLLFLATFRQSPNFSVSIQFHTVWVTPAWRHSNTRAERLRYVKTGELTVSLYAETKLELSYLGTLHCSPGMSRRVNPQCLGMPRQS
ncbi:hypothetical protein PoB_002770500 [Plakobranchus ocellatus]|uniref:Secreted protein n=1 Tax=Plakobranchus ocellatus TaxID=259542 RepID=A0AAV4A2P3_9GAST|nr:hypothetical protein PoB_002770500 [Plakobranchus ocellatus]